MVLNAQLRTVLHSDNLLVGKYALCYVSKDDAWDANTGVDSETGIELVIQNAVIAAKVGGQPFGSSLQAPRNNFMMTLKLSLIHI